MGPKPWGWNTASTRLARRCAVRMEAATFAGLCPKSSTTCTPRTSPRIWKRRATPTNRWRGPVMDSSGTPTARHAAMAASAFSMLWRPGTESSKRVVPMRKAHPSGVSTRSSAQSWASFPKPKIVAPSRNSRRFSASPTMKDSATCPRKVRNMPATTSISLWSFCRFSTTPTAG